GGASRGEGVLDDELVAAVLEVVRVERAELRLALVAPAHASRAFEEERAVGRLRENGPGLCRHREERDELSRHARALAGRDRRSLTSRSRRLARAEVGEH